MKKKKKNEGVYEGNDYSWGSGTLFSLPIGGKKRMKERKKKNF